MADLQTYKAASPGAQNSQNESALSEATDISKSAAERRAALQRFRQQAPESTDSRIRGAERMLDFDTGVERGQQLIGDGSLGRVATSLERLNLNSFEEGRSAEMSDILERRRKSLSGLSAEEAMAERTKATQEMQRGEEGARRKLSGTQAQLGVRGDSAATQQLSVMAQGMQNRANFERDLIIANQQIRTQALDSYEAGVRGSEASERAAKEGNLQISQFNAAQQLREVELQKFNLQQAAKERFGQISIGFGMTQLGSAEASADKAAAAQMMAAAAKQSGGK